MREILEGLGAIIVGVIALALTAILTIALMAVPFIAIGIGLGFIGWAFCLFVSFC